MSSSNGSIRGENELFLTDVEGMDDANQHHEGGASPAVGSSPTAYGNEDFRFLENQKELIALQRLDDKCAKLQEEGKYTEALECMEKGLVLRQHFFGADSDEVWQSCKTVGEMCNLLAMTYLQQEQFPVVLELLKKAEILTEQHPAGRAVTFNNFACYYRRQGNLHKALGYLNEAIKIESKLENIPNRADTHLNLCAVLSQLGKHQNALEYAQSALILLHEELQVAQHGTTNQHAIEGPKLDRMAVLGVAYHNVGVEQEFLKRYDLSIQSYKKGVELTSRFLGDSHGIVVTLQNSLLQAKRNVASKARSDGPTGDGISGHRATNRFAQLKSSLKTSLARKSNKIAAKAPRTNHSRVATDG
ncbi:TPA: hypothetical protein N0F65_008395 [Lagenidium giganteum]|uniref:Kinesin light chain n=1 Tax=Lagenidium giganteum TaxID=4803 RepID=A0AAV2YY59_9STRA|nr:TPA: hypothetical protein N0F65_008395 [Lagenidium giganteum]